MAPRPIDVTLKGKDETKPAFDSAEKNAAGFGERLKTSIMNPLNIIKAGIAGVLTSTLGAFAKASVESAAAADAAWGRVQSAVTNAGMDFGLASVQLDRLFTKIQQTTRYSDDDAASAFAVLVRMSRDYTGSIKNLGLVTDIAAAKGIGLSEAAEVVGKVMAGNTSQLKKFGVTILEGEDAMSALRRQFSGFAERDGNTLQGKLAQIANAWDNVKEAMGRSLTSIDDTGKATNLLASGLNNLGKWIDDNKKGLQETVGFLSDIFGFLNKIGLFKAPVVVHDESGIKRFARSVGLLGGISEGQRRRDDAANEAFAKQHEDNIARARELSAQAERDALARKQNFAAANAEAAKKASEEEAKYIGDLKHEYELLNSLGRISKLNNDQRDRQFQIEQRLRAIANDKTQSIGNRAAAADFVADRDAIEKKIIEDVRRNHADPLRAGTSQHALRIPVTVAVMPARTDLTHSGGTGEAGFGFAGGVRTAFENAAGVTEPLDTALDSLDQRLQKMTGGALAGFFQAWTDGIDDVIHAHNVLGTVVPRIMRKAVGSALATDAQDTMLRAAKALALALTDPSGIHAAQAARLFAVGTAELSAAAALSGGGGGRGVGGGGISAGGFQQSQDDIGGRGKVTVVMPRGKASYAPDELEALAAALQELGEGRDLEFIFGTPA